MGKRDPVVQYVRKNADDAAILAVARKVAYEADPAFTDSELATLAAMRRAHPQAGETNEELGAWLAGMDENQVLGVISNTKGVLHEMEFVRLENEDGDSVFATIFASTTHPGYDIRFSDASTGTHWDAQLKATDNAAYVQEWIDEHPDGEILVTSELAARMDLPSTSLSNGELTARTEDVADRLIELHEDDGLWDYFPVLTLLSISLVIVELWLRWRRGEISDERFRSLLISMSGGKIAKVALLTLALSLPGVSVVAAVGLTMSLLFSGTERLKDLLRSRVPMMQDGVDSALPQTSPMQLVYRSA